MVQVVGKRSAGLSDQIRVWLHAFSRRAEPVEIVEQRFNFLPQRFRWRGKLLQVRQVVTTWDRANTATQPPRRYFEVICQEGRSHVLVQDLRLGIWHLSV